MKIVRSKRIANDAMRAIRIEMQREMHPESVAGLAMTQTLPRSLFLLRSSPLRTIARRPIGVGDQDPPNHKSRLVALEGAERMVKKPNLPSLLAFSR